MIIKKFNPKNKCVMVLRDDTKEKKVGSLYMADRSVELANEGEVRAAMDDGQYQVGDRVIFTKYAGSEFELNGVSYILLPEKDIQGTVTEHEVPDAEAKQYLPQEVPVADPNVEAEVQKALALLATQAENK